MIVTGRKENKNGSSGPISFAVVGGTFSGNKGAVAMLESVIYNLSALTDKKVVFDVLSIYPARDRKVSVPENVRIVPLPVISLITVLPAIAILYSILRKLSLPSGFLLRYKPLEAIVKARAVLDVSGISFVDGRTFTLIYNIACNLPAIIVGTPLIKLSQAIGPFKNPLNRIAASFTLRRAEMIFARGSETENNLKELGIKNFSAAADLAFVLNEHLEIPELETGLKQRLSVKKPRIGIVPSEVMYNYCKKRNVDFVKTMVELAKKLQSELDAGVIIIAHSLLGADTRSRNNDLHVCREIFDGTGKGQDTTLIIDDLTPSQLRSVISSCDVLVASRFHAMVSSLCVGVCPLVTAWSYKYIEVMETFDLGKYVVDVEEMTPELLYDKLVDILKNKEKIKDKISSNLKEVKKSSWSQIEFLERFSGGIPIRLKAGKTPSRLYNLFFRGKFKKTFIGYSDSEEIRDGSASGGLVSTLLVDLLRKGDIDCAIAARTEIHNDALEFKSVACYSEKEVLDCRTSIYSDFNHARNVIQMLNAIEGKCAVVALPCQWKAINSYLGDHPELGNKIVLRIGLWCGHATDRKMIDDFLALRKIDLSGARRFFYRKGLWRGETVIEYTNGETLKIPFSRGYGLFQNLYVDCKKRCFTCMDHFAEESDISFGDAWFRELKNISIKHSIAVAFTERGVNSIVELANGKLASLSEIEPELAVASQKRAVIWHMFGGTARSKVGRLFGVSLPERSKPEPRWNDYISAFMIMLAFKAFSTRLRKMLFRTPWPIHYMYMLVQKFFLNF